MNITKEIIIDMFHDYTSLILNTTKNFNKMSIDRFYFTVEQFRNELLKCDFSKEFVGYNASQINTYSIDDIVRILQRNIENDTFILDYFDFERVYAKFNNVEISENETDDGFIIHSENGDSYIGASEISDWIDEHRKEIINYINNTIFSKENLIKILKV